MNAFFRSMGLGLLGLALATPAGAARNVEILVREDGQAIGGASVCLGYDDGGRVDAIGAIRTDAMGVARFEGVPQNGARFKVNVTAPGLQGATRVFFLTNNHDGTLDPPQMQTVDLPGNGAECEAPGGPDPEPDPEPEPDPNPPGPAGQTTPTPVATFHFRTVDYEGQPVGQVLVCAGDGPGAGGSLFGRAFTDASGNGSIPGIPVGGDGYRRVTLTAVKPCPTGEGPRTTIEGVPVYGCGVGAEYAQPDHADPSDPFLIVIGAVDQDSADHSSPSICPPPTSDPNPTEWRLVSDDEVEEDGSTTVRASLVRGSQSWLMGWLYDFEWEVSDPSVLEIVGPSRTGDRVTVRGKRSGSATVTARLARTDGVLAASSGGRKTIRVTLGGGLDPVRSVATFQSIQDVFVHPRCTNCHTAGETPKQGDNRTPHAADARNVRPRRGDDCTQCHAENPPRMGYDAPFAAGAAWRMPPVQPMAFEDPEMIGQLKLPSAICRDIKESFRQRRMCTTAQECALEVADHVEHDGLVIWSFQPGGSRSPASMRGHADFAAKVRTWALLGGFCPD